MRPKKWTEKNLYDAVNKSKSIRQVLKCLGLKEAGGNYFQIKKYLDFYKIDHSHFTGKAWNKGLRGIGKPIIPIEKVLIRNSNFQSYKLKKRLFAAKLKFPKCEECGWSKSTENGRIPLELDHINGDVHDNRLENLRILCPNCHSLKPTHRGLNRKKAWVMEWNTCNT